MKSAYLVLDIGKTHRKITVLGHEGEIFFVRRAANVVHHGSPYNSIDIEQAWAWFCKTVKGLKDEYAIQGISIATHGATAVLVDLDDGRPLLPVMDYEFDDYPAWTDNYDSLRPQFSETFSPALPGGLNLGRQLHYQLQLLDADSRDRATVLMFANYWAWRLTGVAVSEITSLGCHTDLWNIAENRPSSLVSHLDLANALPPLHKAWEPIGTVSSAVAEETGLSTDCIVLPGLHDSNAGYVPYLDTPREDRPVVLSTGTWSVILDPSASLDRLAPEKDMLANIDAEGNALATARYMGGREFSDICEMTDCDIATTCDAEDVEDAMANAMMALPTFSPGNGPYPRSTGKIIGTPENGKAVASLYSALMLDQILGNLGSQRDIVIEGSFAGNEVLCSLLAALRPDQRVMRHERMGGVVEGCFKMLKWSEKMDETPMEVTEPFTSARLDDYAKSWRYAVEANAPE